MDIKVHLNFKKNFNKIQTKFCKISEQTFNKIIGDRHTSEYSAMAQTVGYPCAIAAQLVLSGKIRAPGMVTPLPKEIYSPILDELAKLGIIAKRTKSYK